MADAPDPQKCPYHDALAKGIEEVGADTKEILKRLGKGDVKFVTLMLRVTQLEHDKRELKAGIEKEFERRDVAFGRWTRWVVGVAAAAFIAAAAPLVVAGIGAIGG